MASLLVTALLPGPLKRLVYRGCFGYRIGKGVSLGVSYLDCERLTVEDGARISHGVAILQCGTVRLGRHVHIGSLNVIRGARHVELDDYSQLRRLNFINAIIGNDCTNNPDPSFYLGYGSAVVAEHRIDCTDRVRIGRRTILAGRNSSIWTHNIRTGMPVEIGDYCYIGSESRFAPGVRIPDFCIVGLGSVVVKPQETPYSLIAGNPAKPRRPLREADHEMIFGKTRPDLPDEPLPEVPGL